MTTEPKADLRSAADRSARAYYSHKAQEVDPALCSGRAQRDKELRMEIHRVWEANFRV